MERERPWKEEHGEGEEEFTGFGHLGRRTNG